MQKPPTSYKKRYLIVMGTRKSPTDIINRAQSNGFKSGLHYEEDKKTGLQKYDEKTLGAQDQVLEKYAIYLNNKHVTVFEEFEAMLLYQARGRLRERPTARSLKASAKSFNGGFKRRTGNSVPAETIAEINSWIGGPLTSEEGSGVTNIERPKYNYKPQDLDRNLKALWSRSDIGVRHERERFQFHFLLLLFCDTGARRGGLFRAGIPYKKDKTVFLDFFFRLPSAQSKTTGILKIGDHDFFTQILNGKGDGSIEWKEAALELPVCRSVDRNGCLTSEAMTFAGFEPFMRETADHTAVDYFQGLHRFHQPDARAEAQRARKNAVKRLRKKTLQEYREECLKALRKDRLINGFHATNDTLDPLNEVFPEKRRMFHVSHGVTFISIIAEETKWLEN
ncbi:hypothetical protein MY5147_007992 [Beauveria neobassiana]